MLALKDSPLLYRGRTISTSRTAFILTLPHELLVAILEALYFYNARHGRIYNILAAARTCRVLRQAALPLLFETISCSVRESFQERPHASFRRICEHRELLRNVRTLDVHCPLRVDDAISASQAGSQSNPADSSIGARTNPSQDDLDSIQAAIPCMPRLRRIKYRGCWGIVLTLTTFLRYRQDILVVLEDVTTHSHARCCALTPEALRNGINLLFSEQRPLAIGHMDGDLAQTDRVRTVEALMLTQSDHPSMTSTSPTLSSLMKDQGSYNRASFPALKELHLRTKTYRHEHEADPVLVDERWVRNVHSILSHSLIQRLAITGKWVFGQAFDLSLPNLESLRIQIVRPVGRHTQICSWYQPEGADGDTHARFRIEYDRLPRLFYVHIEGVCNHIPVKNIVGERLRGLKLHFHLDRASTSPHVSQRSPADVLEIARIAPNMQSLQLDIGDISKLWHPTAIPGVDVNNELYSFLAALSDFQHLRTLRLFPPYVSSNVFTAQGPNQQQPLSDTDAVAMFLRLRRQISSLESFFISPSDYSFYNTNINISRTAIAQRNDFRAMSWAMYIWGEQTILYARQARKQYTQRQVWIGNRKLRSEILRDTYDVVGNCTAGGALPDDEPWILDPLMRH